MNKKVIFISLIGAASATYLIYYFNKKKSDSEKNEQTESDIVFIYDNPEYAALTLAEKLKLAADKKYADFYKYAKLAEQEKINQYVELEKKDPAFTNPNIIPDRIFINDMEQPRGILYE